MPKEGKGKGRGGQPYSLEKQMELDKAPKPMKHKARRNRDTPDEAPDSSVPAHLSKKILALSRMQRAEDAMDDGDDDETVPQPEEEKKTEETATETMAMAMEDNGDGAEEDEAESGDDEDEAQYGDGDVQVNEEDEKALALFMKPTSGNGGRSAGDAAPRLTLGDIIAEKLRDMEAAKEERKARKEREVVNPKVAEMYTTVGAYLKRYTTGRLPKAFKVLPTLRNWEDLMFLTRPDEWSPHAMRAAVRMFVSGLNVKMAQRFFSIVLLPCVRDYIRANKKLHFALYMALKKALYKPMAFFKGFLLPLCEEGDCTLREAIIVASVLAKVSVPMLHSAACIVKIAGMEYSGANSVFLRTLLDKKYSLPFRVVDSVVRHFASFARDQRKMVVLWHQCLLVFVQRYKGDLTSEQKATIRELIKIHNHALITPEIRFELDSAPARGETSAPVPSDKML